MPHKLLTNQVAQKNTEEYGGLPYCVAKGDSAQFLLLIKLTTTKKYYIYKLVFLWYCFAYIIAPALFPIIVVIDVST